MARIFVFGSNLAGHHGAGAALYARQHHGAIYGRGEGIQGESYAIPTKDARLRVLSLDEIRKAVDRFIGFAAVSNDMFQVTRIGCGLAGYRDEQIAPLFKQAPSNCELPDGWRQP